MPIPGLGSAPAEPFRAFPPGVYQDARIHVGHRRAGLGDGGGTLVTRTAHFELYRSPERWCLIHELHPDQLSNDLTGMLVDELFAPGWLQGNPTFESAFTGLVRTTIDDPLRAWLVFYRNTLGDLQHARSPHSGGRPAGTTAGMAPVYDRALTLVPAGRVLDLGSCFGFLPLLLTGTRRHTVTASDISAPTMTLLATVAHALGRRIETIACDAARVPLPDNAVDTVTAIHLLEHLTPEHTMAVLREALRLARRRVIVAVPFEPEPNPAFGHRQTFDLPALTEIGRGLGTRCAVFEHHGGWLVLVPECADATDPVTHRPGPDRHR
ncbi:MAG: mycofactocin oligosaccharide methyltransferase MftM [Mycobacterium sp.]|uniref:mycofactocin oligosaccharide methyltransferase MftM n=1 Tax=Mycobacterium sp. TaxID=1785 RepID=UPI00260CC264|nr:mycofactocin oligosaccharide methyltransferase MftM [Mycobacterium sp.]MDI3313099.1 mycofactocin oligosaccharide methyltransferase MftM [Mycobacterium sp.]